MLHVLAQPDAARMRAGGHAELGRHQQDGQDLVDSAEPAGVDLADIDGAGLEQLLEDDAVQAEQLARRRCQSRSAASILLGWVGSG